MTDPAHADPPPGDPESGGRPSILFACRANAGRSVTARVLAEHYAGDRVDVHSAGSEPGTEIHPEVARALVDLGLDVSNETPKPFDPAARYTAVVTMGCGEACPYYAGATYDEWPIADPKGQDEQTVKAIVADIDARVRKLLQQLVPSLELIAAAPAGPNPEPLELAWTPETCTLPTSEKPLRISEFDQFFTRSLLTQTRFSPTRLQWKLLAASEAAARDLAARETACCSFFTFSFLVDDDLTVDVEVPPERADVLDALEERAAVSPRIG